MISSLLIKNTSALLLLLVSLNIKGQTGAKSIRVSNPIIINEQMPDSVSDFAFKDSLNRDITLKNFKGSYVIIDIWYSGCGACIHCNEGMRTVHEKLKGKNLVFISLSIDQNRKTWMLGITKGAKRDPLNDWAGKYWPAPGTITLYTAGTGIKNPLISKYVPHGSYPQLLLINPEGKVISNNLPRPDFEPGNLVGFIKNHME